MLADTLTVIGSMRQGYRNVIFTEGRTGKHMLLYIRFELFHVRLVYDPGLEQALKTFWEHQRKEDETARMRLP
jgi:hypothetical protein